MRLRLRAAAPLLMLAGLAACDSNPTLCCSPGGPSALRVVNAYTGPVDVLVDGVLAIPSLASSALATAVPEAGTHLLTFRPTGTGASTSQSITTTRGASSTVAAVRSSTGAVATAVLDDTGSAVPAGATKLRVVHLAPNAGELQVYRTQPDFQQPTRWQFPFTYQAEPNALSAPFYQSTVGTWEVRIWQTPADASGWATAPLRVVVPLGSGEKRTILILDAPGGGVRAEVI